MGAEPGEISGVNAFIFPDATNWRTLSSSSPETLDVEVDCHVGRSRYAEKSQAVGKCKCKWGQMQMGSGLAFKHNRGLFCERSAASCSNCMIARPAPGFMLGKCVNARPDPVCTQVRSTAGLCLGAKITIARSTCLALMMERADPITVLPCEILE